MRSKILIGTIVCSLSAVFILGGNLFASKVPAASLEGAVSTAIGGQGIPMRLKIPKIQVDAAIEQAALANDGTMDVPKGPADAAWFNRGPRPGEKGSAVIDGHFGWKDGIPAVFDNLNTLQKGDMVYIEDESGVISTFVVREIRTFSKSGNSSEVFSSSDGKAHLNLITCEGTWNAAEKSYSNRLVVFTDKQ